MVKYEWSHRAIVGISQKTPPQEVAMSVMGQAKGIIQHLTEVQAEKNWTVI